MGVRLIFMPYRGERGMVDQSDAPAAIIANDGFLSDLGSTEAGDSAIETIALTPEQNHQYGEWQRVAMANRHLANSVTDALHAGDLPIGLLANCNALPGMLAGLQRASGCTEHSTCGRVGLIWIDAHADFNTPETTLSGMLGGMPVALSAGLCLHRLREAAGMSKPLDPSHIIMAGLRDVDPLEQELLDRHDIRQFPLSSVAESSGRGEREDEGIKPLIDAAHELAESCEAIYVHVDIDVLDPAEVPGHPLTVEGGPTSGELSSLIVNLFMIPQVAALGVASTPPPDLDPFATARRAAQRLVRAAMTGHERAQIPSAT